MTFEVEPSSLPATRSPRAKSKRQRPFTLQRTAGEPMNPAFQGLTAEARHNWRLELDAIDWHVTCSSREADRSLKDMRTPSLRFLKTFQIAAKRGSFRAAAIFFASELLLPRRASFSAVHGDIDIQIATGITPNEEHASDADVSIVVGTGDWTDVQATRLFPQTYVLACSPELLRHSSIRSIPRPRCCMRPSVASALRWCSCRCRRRGFRPAR